MGGGGQGRGEAMTVKHKVEWMTCPDCAALFDRTAYEMDGRNMGCPVCHHVVAWKADPPEVAAQVIMGGKNIGKGYRITHPEYAPAIHETPHT